MVVINQLLDKKCGLPVVRALDLCSELSDYLITPNRLDLGNPDALLLYNQLILRELMELEFSVPKGYLIPTICSRWEFIKFIIRDFEKLPKSMIEIGTGSSAILAMIFGSLGVKMKATEINEGAYESALTNVERNYLTETIEVIKSNGEIVTNLFSDLSAVDAIICNPPQYDQKFYHSRQGSPRGFKGKYSELVGGIIGHEFILKLLDEVNHFKHSPPVYFQLTLPKLQIEINNDLVKNNYHYSIHHKKIGTRLRLYYKIDFGNRSNSS